MAIPPWVPAVEQVITDLRIIDITQKSGHTIRRISMVAQAF
jgi:hypothetical protein